MTRIIDRFGTGSPVFSFEFFPPKSDEGAEALMETVLDLQAAVNPDYVSVTYGAGGTSLAYITVGTGIGVGLVTGGRTVHGAGHPEMGHIFPRRDREDFDFPGHCPFHGDCMEGLASGPAILARWGAMLSDLPPGHPAHTYVAGYLAQLCHTAFATVAVETIVLGGGVMQTPGLLDAVRERTFALGAEYLPGRSRQQIVAPKLGQESGISGALQLAARAFEGAND